MSDTTKIDTMSSTTVSGGVARLEGSPGAFPVLGTLQSVAIAPSYLYHWKTFTAATSIPTQTEIVFRFYDGTGSNLIPEGELLGNAVGFATSTVDLSSVSTTTYSRLRIHSTLSSNDPVATPSVDQYAIAYDYGPEPLPNLSFSMRGNKTIGNNPAVYKYDQTHSSGASASITLSNVEADTYTLSVATSTGYLLAESCNTQPEILPPASSQTTRLYVLPASNHSLLIDVRSNAGALLEGASVQLTGVSYDTTKTTSSCGQAFFGSLSNGNFVATVTRSGYLEYTTNVNVNGMVYLSIVLNPQ